MPNSRAFSTSSTPLNAAVGRDDEFHAVLFRSRDEGHSHIVAVALAVRHENRDVPPRLRSARVQSAAEVTPSPS